MSGFSFALLLGGAAVQTASSIADLSNRTTLTISSVIIPEKHVSEGILIRSTSAVWFEIVRVLGSDWTQAFRLPSEKWEEIVAGAFSQDGYSVILTPRSGDHGRDVIATKANVGSVKILGSVKAYAPHRTVSYDAVRALYGVVAGDPAASKGIITTTSDFPPEIHKDPSLAPAMPTRLELMNGPRLQKWLTELAASKS